jgi:hypothetical protein
MKQLTLQEHYNLIKEGKGHKDMFLKAAKSQFPNIVPNAATFEQTSTLLKQRSIISENIWGVATGKTTQPDWFSIFNDNINEAKYDSSVASSQEEPVKNNDKKVSKEVEENLDNNFDYKDPKNRDNVYGQDFLIGYYAEMKDPKNSEKTVDELLELVSKNLAKDRLHYVKDGQFGVKGLGYTEDAPGLGAGKEAKGKYKSSGYGDLKERLGDSSKTYAVYELSFGQPYNFYNEEENKFIWADAKKATLYTKEEAEAKAKELLKPRVDNYQKTGENYKEIHTGDLYKKNILKENKNPMFEGLGDGPLDKLFYKEYPKTKNEILKFLSKHKRGLSADEKSYYVDRYMKMIEKDLRESYETYKPKGPQNDAFHILLNKKYSEDQINKVWDKNYNAISKYYNELNKANRGSTNVAQELANFIDKKINENKNTMIKLMDLFEGEYYMPETKEKKKPMTEKKKVKKSAIADRVKQIEEESIFNAMEGKIQAMAEEIEMRENKLSMIDENEDLQEFINPVRIKEMQKEIDELKKTKLKMENEYEKKSKGRKPKEVIDEAEEETEEKPSKTMDNKDLANILGSFDSTEDFKKAWNQLILDKIAKRKEEEAAQKQMRKK